ncbi:MAG: hypothetical protein BRD37_02995 [Bacteroidetes bacterium QH_8_67_23]|nr:MAG: hypothetical protein BRD37_02995 [Bacteroidetes bacterium QH_8_67_23]
MALFGKEEGSTMARSSSSSGEALPDQINMVGEGTVFEGTLRAESNVRVSGHIKGKLDVDGRVIVTQEGVVEGELHAADADVAGSMRGEIYVSERLMLKSTARIDGTRDGTAADRGKRGKRGGARPALGERARVQRRGGRHAGERRSGERDDRARRDGGRLNGPPADRARAGRWRRGF